VGGQKLLLAVSGGADSIALLFGSAQIASALEVHLEVASLDHGLRAESAAEVENVQQLASSLGLPFHSRRLGLMPGCGLEARARNARYHALEEIRAESGLDWIVTAHTASDQAETLLMRLLRGASLSGASGIRARRGRLLRPLLVCTRTEVDQFVSELTVECASDAMNRDVRFARSRVRAELIPAIEAVGGSRSIRHLAAFAAIAAEDDQYLDELAKAAYARLLQSPGRLDAAGVRALVPPLRRRVIVRMIEEAGARVDSAAVGRALAALRSGGRAALSQGFEIRSAGGILRCARAPEPRGQAASLSLTEGWVADPVSGLRIGVADSPPLNRSPDHWLEIPESPLPLIIRRRQPGDRVGGAGRRGATKLQDVMVDLGIPREERERVPIVCDAAGRILWVVGVWPRRRVKAPSNPATGARRYLLVERMSGPASADLCGSL
jgi:tRNA(Ile)-lysidine synthase